MAKKYMKYLVVFLLLILSSSLWAFEGLKIVSVDLKGNVNTDSTLIKAQLSSKVGNKLDYRLVSKDVRDLFFLGYFTDIKVDARRVPGGVALTFIFTEYDKIEKVSFEGNKDISDGDLKETVTLKKGAVYTKSALKKNIEKIVAKYKQKGFINVAVTHTFKPDPKTRKGELTFRIREGDKIVIHKIYIQGAKQLDAGAVKGTMQETHETGLFRSGVFDKEKFKKDKQKIVEYYHDRGFIKMKIAKVDMAIRRVKPKEPKKGIFLTITVAEGKRYKAGDFKFQGNEVFEDDFILKKLFTLKKGQYFNESQNKKDMATLWQAYREKGYIFANIVPIRDVNEASRVVNVTYRVFEGDKAHIEKIRIKGNNSSKDYVIAREIRVKEGEVFNSRKIRRSQERLFNLRFFKDVNIEVEPGSAEGLMNLIFSVKEDRTGLFTLGAGYGTVTGFSFYEQLSENNLFGMGFRVHERFEWGDKRKGIQLGFDTPYLFRYNPTSAGFSVSYFDTRVVNIDTNLIASPASDQEYSFQRKSFEIQLRLGRSLSEYWRVYSSYTFAWLDSYNANFEVASQTDATNKTDTQQQSIDDLREALEGGFTTKSSLRFGAVYDTRDYVGGPSKGIYLSQFFTYTGGLLGGSSHYILSDSTFSFFVPLMWGFVFAQDIRVDLIFNQLDGRSKIYPGDELKFDGMTELRGWSSYDEGGRAKVATLTEIRYPIDKRMLWGVLFFDMGNLWPEHDQISFRLDRYKFSFGLGFRVQLSVLPIRLYFAKRFDYDENGNFRWLGGAEKGFFHGWETVFSVAGIF